MAGARNTYEVIAEWPAYTDVMTKIRNALLAQIRVFPSSNI